MEIVFRADFEVSEDVKDSRLLYNSTLQIACFIGLSETFRRPNGPAENFKRFLVEIIMKGTLRIAIGRIMQIHPNTPTAVIAIELRFVVYRQVSKKFIL